MHKFRAMLVKVPNYRRGQTMTEYALIMATVAVVLIVSYQTMGSTITGFLVAVGVVL